jgi:protein ImuA
MTMACGHIVRSDERIAAVVREMERLSSLGSHAESRTTRICVPTGMDEIDAALPRGGLESGRVHEWVGVRGIDCGERAEVGRVRRRGTWSPALELIAEMVGRAAGLVNQGRGRVVWVGEAVWPYPAVLVRATQGGHAGDDGQIAGGARLLDRCLFVRARTRGDRVWATDLALRNRAAGVVVADGSGFDLAATRRLQLGAEAGGAVCLLARPWWEAGELSAATTRWLVRDVEGEHTDRRWSVELLRCKGLRPGPGVRSAWVVERDRATRSLGVVADVLDGPAAAPAEVGVRRTG